MYGLWIFGYIGKEMYLITHARYIMQLNGTVQRGGYLVRNGQCCTTGAMQVKLLVWVANKMVGGVKLTVNYDSK